MAGTWPAVAIRPMMTPVDITVVLLSSRSDRPVLQAIERLRQYERVSLDIVVLHRPGWRETASRLAELGGNGVRFYTEEQTRGAALNVIVESSPAAWFALVEPEDVLTRGYLTAAIFSLREHESRGYAASPTDLHPGKGETDLA